MLFAISGQRSRFNSALYIFIKRKYTKVLLASKRYWNNYSVPIAIKVMII